MFRWRLITSLATGFVLSGCLLSLASSALAAPSPIQESTQASTEAPPPDSQAIQPTEGSSAASNDGAPAEATAPQPAGADDAADGTESEKETKKESTPLVTNDAAVFGFLAIILGAVFWTSRRNTPFWRKFYRYVPMLLLCYFLPSLLTAFGIVDPEKSNLYFVSTRYLLPASLVLLTLSIDLREIVRLGPKALIMFFAGTVGVVVGGPLAVWLISLVAPDLVRGDDVWRGLSTVAGSWIGGGANQTAMKEIFGPSNAMYSAMIAVDVIVAEVWMALLLLGIDRADSIDAAFQADSSSVRTLRDKMERFAAKSARIPNAADFMILLALAFGATGFSHLAADFIAPWIAENAPYLSRFSLDSGFFWLIVLATTAGVLLSFSPARQLEGVGASKMGTVFIFILVASIGLKMDIRAVFEHPGMFLIGALWMSIHVGIMFLTAYFIRAPYFFLAVGSKANIGGAASAPVVAAAFHPSLAPVGVLLAVLGYALGTYGAWLSAMMMRAVAPS